MNNVEVYEHFIETLKEVHPNMTLDKRDELVIGMAINHTFLFIRGKVLRYEKALNEIALYEGDFYSDDMALIAKEAIENE